MDIDEWIQNRASIDFEKWENEYNGVELIEDKLSLRQDLNEYELTLEQLRKEYWTNLLKAARATSTVKENYINNSITIRKTYLDVRQDYTEVKQQLATIAILEMLDFFLDKFHTDAYWRDKKPTPEEKLNDSIADLVAEMAEHEIGFDHMKEIEGLDFPLIDEYGEEEDLL